MFSTAGRCRDCSRRLHQEPKARRSFTLWCTDSSQRVSWLSPCLPSAQTLTLVLGLTCAQCPAKAFDHSTGPSSSHLPLQDPRKSLSLRISFPRRTRAQLDALPTVPNSPDGPASSSRTSSPFEATPTPPPGRPNPLRTSLSLHHSPQWALYQARRDLP